MLAKRDCGLATCKAQINACVGGAALVAAVSRGLCNNPGPLWDSGVLAWSDGACLCKWYEHKSSHLLNSYLQRHFGAGGPYAHGTSTWYVNLAFSTAWSTGAVRAVVCTACCGTLCCGTPCCGMPNMLLTSMEVHGMAGCACGAIFMRSGQPLPVIP